MKINKATMKIWSRIGSRAAFGLTAVELGKTMENLMILTADVSTSAGLDRFRKTHPEKYLDVGIAEQNMMGIAAGLASEGHKVITSTFAPFQTMRCCEQIKVNLGYMNNDVCMVGLSAGIVLGTLGYTHCSIEDIAIMRAIPGMTVISPADSGETVKATIASMKHKGPIYIRLTGGTPNPMVYEDDYDFEIGKANILKNGKDITIFACGTMVYEALQTSNLLLEKGISACVVNMHTIKPLDTMAIKNACEGTNLIVSIEEHNIIGGLGSAIAEYKSTLKNSPPQLILGHPDLYGKSGEYNDLLEKYGLTSPQIADKILQLYQTL